MRWVWVAIMVVSGAPVLYVAAVMNPLSIVIAGVDWWRDQLIRLAPYRFRIAFAALVFAFSLGVYLARYG
jgi:hypothetical protein